MSADPEHLTRPEQFTAIGHSRAFMKREFAKGRACSYCLHRTTESAWGLHGCKLNPNRSYPGCSTDRRGPEFQLDESTVKGKVHG